MFYLKNSLNRVMRSILVAGIGFAAFLYGASPASAQVLGAAQSFAVLGGSAVAANGSGGHINGDVGIAPAADTFITGIPANATVTSPFVNQGNNAAAIAARDATLTLYGFLAAMGGATAIPLALNGQSLGPGTYSTGNATLSSGSPLILTGAGQYVFQVNSLTTAVGSSVTLNGVDPCMVFWQVATIAALNGTTFPGNIVAGPGAGTGVHLVTAGSSLLGRALSSAGGDVTMVGGTVGGCSVLGQAVTPFLAVTTLSRTGPLPAGKVGTPMTDTKTLSGGLGSAAPTGTIIFTLFSDASCTNLVFTSSPVTVTGNGTYTSPTSPSFTPSVPGTFHWIATYSGDVNNAPTATLCGDTTESVNVAAAMATPTLSTVASPGVTLGAAIFDTATLSGGTGPTGTITFSLYGPNDPICDTTAIFTSAVTVTGNGIYTSASSTPLVIGTYRWRAGYSGDANNAATLTACADVSESVIVSKAVTGADIPTLSGWGLMSLMALIGVASIYRLRRI